MKKVTPVEVWTLLNAIAIVFLGLGALQIKDRVDVLEAQPQIECESKN